MRRARLFVLFAFLGFSLAEVQLAAAGTFDVAVCDAAPGFANNSWRPDVTHGGMTVYLACPAGDDPRFGLGARHNEYPAGWTVPSGAAARWIFDAPAGTAIVGIRADALWEQFDHRWQVGLSNGSQLLEGCPATGAATGGVCSAAMYAANYHALPPSGVIYSEVYCAFGPCPVGGAGKFWARGSITYAVVTIADSTPPAIANLGGSLWTDRWTGGTQRISLDASDNTGIKALHAYLDGVEKAGTGRACDPTVRTCPDWPGADLAVATAPGVSDGRHTLTVRAVDRADNPTDVTRHVFIDNTAPAAPIGLSVVGGDGWKSAARARVSWANPRQDAAPIAGASYRLCPASGETSGCVAGSRDGRDLKQISDLQLPKPGDWVLTLWLRDEAANSRPETAAAPVHLRFDPDPPGVAILPQDPEDPARLRVRATDGLSGIARGEIELRRRGAAAWRSLPAELDANGFSTVLDDEYMRDGTYDVRARAWDAAGNERSSDHLMSGTPATLTLPVRVKTLLRVGKTRRVRARGARRGRRARRTIYVRRPMIRNGRRVRLRGRLTAPGGNPLQGAGIEVSARLALPGAAFQPVARLTTSRTGRFNYLLPAGPSRVLRFRYPGAPKIRAQTREVDVRVRATTTIWANRRVVVNGDLVRFAGRLRGGNMPAGGKLVEVQYFSRGKWRTFRTTRAAPSSGRWRSSYRFTGTRGTVRYRFRVRIPRENGYPYARGSSRVVRIKVKGL